LIRAPWRLVPIVLGLALVAAADAGAQWLKLPTPGIPRLPDGKPNLTAPVPRTAEGKPDLSGLWENAGGDRLYNNIAADMQPGDVAPRADALYRRRRCACPFGPVYLTTRFLQVRLRDSANAGGS
jgi:hypothetical protein